MKNEQIKNEAVSIIKNKNVVFPLFELRARWKEEKDFEDFNEYIDAVKTKVKEQGYKFVKLTKTFSLTLEGKIATYCIKLKGLSASISLAK